MNRSDMEELECVDSPEYLTEAGEVDYEPMEKTDVCV